MKLNLPESVASPQDLASVIAEIRLYAKWASHELIKQRVGTKGHDPQPEISSASSEIVREWSGGKSLTQANIDELLKSLDTYKKQAPTMSITLAGIPSNEVKVKLVKWCRKELASDVLVSFHMNRNILGGMVVNYGSHIFDWSFRRKLLETKTSFSEVLGRV